MPLKLNRTLYTVNADLNTKASVDSPALEGTPTAPTPSVGDNSTKVATTQFINSIIVAGIVVPFAGSTAPVGWLLCDGSAVSRSTYTSLFSTIGTSHGSGDGISTFRIPDYRGRFLRGLDGSAGNDPDSSSRTAANTGGNVGNNVGSIQNHQVQSHTHTMQSIRGAGSETNSGSPGSGVATSSTFVPVINSFGGNETRPKNINVNYIIKV